MAPLVLALTAGWLGESLGCRVDEGSVHPCRLVGLEIGDLLHQVGTLGWLALVTLPLGLVGLVIWTGFLVLARRGKT
jgi:hypothetical protein